MYIITILLSNNNNMSKTPKELAVEELDYLEGLYHNHDHKADKCNCAYLLEEIADYKEKLANGYYEEESVVDITRQVIASR